MFASADIVRPVFNLNLDRQRKFILIRTLLLSAAIVCGQTSPGVAQTPSTEDRATSSAMPSPALPDNAKASEFLRAAQVSLIAGRADETRQALEMAQTRLLDRSVPLFQTNASSDNPAVLAISRATAATVV